MKLGGCTTFGRMCPRSPSAMSRSGPVLLHPSSPSAESLEWSAIHAKWAYRDHGRRSPANTASGMVSPTIQASDPDPSTPWTDRPCHFWPPNNMLYARLFSFSAGPASIVLTCTVLSPESLEYCSPFGEPTVHIVHIAWWWLVKHGHGPPVNACMHACRGLLHT